MISINPRDLLHKAQLLRVLTEIADDPILSQTLYFKGGTCAAMLGYLDRFSVDLDFDLKNGSVKEKVLSKFGNVFEKLNLKIENENKEALMFILKYDSPKNQRNTLKISVNDQTVKANDYEAVFLPQIVRLVNCQTVETMFANKLVAPIDRFNKHEKIAGRDIYDINYFFSRGFTFKDEVIEERTGLTIEKYIEKLIKFIEEKITETVLSEDLNTLLPLDKFQKIRKTLKQDTLIFLRSL